MIMRGTSSYEFERASLTDDWGTGTDLTYTIRQVGRMSRDKLIFTSGQTSSSGCTLNFQISSRASTSGSFASGATDFIDYTYSGSSCSGSWAMRFSADIAGTDCTQQCFLAAAVVTTHITVYNVGRANWTVAGIPDTINAPGSAWTANTYLHSAAWAPYGGTDVHSMSLVVARKTASSTAMDFYWYDDITRYWDNTQSYTQSTTVSGLSSSTDIYNRVSLRISRDGLWAFFFEARANGNRGAAFVWNRASINVRFDFTATPTTLTSNSWTSDTPSGVPRRIYWGDNAVFGRDGRFVIFNELETNTELQMFRRNPYGQWNLEPFDTGSYGSFSTYYPFGTVDTSYLGGETLFLSASYDATSCTDGTQSVQQFSVGEPQCIFDVTASASPSLSASASSSSLVVTKSPSASGSPSPSTSASASPSVPDTAYHSITYNVSRFQDFESGYAHTAKFQKDFAYYSQGGQYCAFIDAASAPGTTELKIRVYRHLGQSWELDSNVTEYSWSVYSQRTTLAISETGYVLVAQGSSGARVWRRTSLGTPWHEATKYTIGGSQGASTAVSSNGTYVQLKNGIYRWTGTGYSIISSVSGCGGTNTDIAVGESKGFATGTDSAPTFYSASYATGVVKIKTPTPSTTTCSAEALSVKQSSQIPFGVTDNKLCAIQAATTKFYSVSGTTATEVHSVGSTSTTCGFLTTDAANAYLDDDIYRNYDGWALFSASQSVGYESFGSGASFGYRVRRITWGGGGVAFDRIVFTSTAVTNSPSASSSPSPVAGSVSASSSPSTSPSSSPSASLSTVPEICQNWDDPAICVAETSPIFHFGQISYDGLYFLGRTNTATVEYSRADIQSSWAYVTEFPDGLEYRYLDDSRQISSDGTLTISSSRGGGCYTLYNIRRRHSTSLTFLSGIYYYSGSSITGCSQGDAYIASSTITGDNCQWKDCYAATRIKDGVYRVFRAGAYYWNTTTTSPPYKDFTPGEAYSSYAIGHGWADFNNGTETVRSFLHVHKAAASTTITLEWYDHLADAFDVTQSATSSGAVSALGTAISVLVVRTSPSQRWLAVGDSVGSDNRGVVLLWQRESTSQRFDFSVSPQVLTDSSWTATAHTRVSFVEFELCGYDAQHVVMGAQNVANQEIAVFSRLVNTYQYQAIDITSFGSYRVNAYCTKLAGTRQYVLASRQLEDSRTDLCGSGDAQNTLQQWSVNSGGICITPSASASASVSTSPSPSSSPSPGLASASASASPSTSASPSPSTSPSSSASPSPPTLPPSASASLSPSTSPFTASFSPSPSSSPFTASVSGSPSPSPPSAAPSSSPSASVSFSPATAPPSASSSPSVSHSPASAPPSASPSSSVSTSPASSSPSSSGSHSPATAGPSASASTSTSPSAPSAGPTASASNSPSASLASAPPSASVSPSASASPVDYGQCSGQQFPDGLPICDADIAGTPSAGNADHAGTRMFVPPAPVNSSCLSVEYSRATVYDEWTDLGCNDFRAYGNTVFSEDNLVATGSFYTYSPCLASISIVRRNASGNFGDPDAVYYYVYNDAGFCSGGEFYMSPAPRVGGSDCTAAGKCLLAARYHLDRIAIIDVTAGAWETPGELPWYTAEYYINNHTFTKVTQEWVPYPNASHYSLLVIEQNVYSEWVTFKWLDYLWSQSSAAESGDTSTMVLHHLFAKDEWGYSDTSPITSRLSYDGLWLVLADMLSETVFVWKRDSVAERFDAAALQQILRDSFPSTNVLLYFVPAYFGGKDGRILSYGTYYTASSGDRYISRWIRQTNGTYTPSHYSLPSGINDGIGGGLVFVSLTQLSYRNGQELAFLSGTYNASGYCPDGESNGVFQIAYTSECTFNSASASPSASPSTSFLVSASPSSSPSGSQSGSPSPSTSASLSPSPSTTPSASGSPSPSVSASAPSASVSASGSPSGSGSPSASPSASASASPDYQTCVGQTRIPTGLAICDEDINGVVDSAQYSIMTYDGTHAVVKTSNTSCGFQEFQRSTVYDEWDTHYCTNVSLYHMARVSEDGLVVASSHKDLGSNPCRMNIMISRRVPHGAFGGADAVRFALERSTHYCSLAGGYQWWHTSVSIGGSSCAGGGKCLLATMLYDDRITVMDVTFGVWNTTETLPPTHGTYTIASPTDTQTACVWVPFPNATDYSLLVVTRDTAGKTIVFNWLDGMWSSGSDTAFGTTTQYTNANLAQNGDFAFSFNSFVDLVVSPEGLWLAYYESISEDLLLWTRASLSDRFNAASPDQIFGNAFYLSTAASYFYRTRMDFGGLDGRIIVGTTRHDTNTGQRRVPRYARYNNGTWREDPVYLNSGPSPGDVDAGSIHSSPSRLSVLNGQELVFISGPFNASDYCGVEENTAAFQYAYTSECTFSSNSPSPSASPSITATPSASATASPSPSPVTATQVGSRRFSSNGNAPGSNPPNSSGKSNTGTIVAATVSGAVVLVLVVAFVYSHRKNKHRSWRTNGRARPRNWTRMFERQRLLDWN